MPCWKCRYCQRGQYWMCQVHDIYGFRQRTFGAMAEYMLFPAGALNYKVPKSIPVEHAAFIEPLACSIHAVERGDIKFQDVVVIAGAGPLGLGMVAAARMKNPRLLVSVDLNDKRLATAKACGADLGINPGQGRRGRRGAEAHRRLWLRRLYRGDRPSRRRRERAAHDPQARHLRRVQRHARAGDRRLDDHRRHQGAEHPRLASRAYCYPVAIKMIEEKRLPMDEIITHQLPLAEFQRGIELVGKGTESIKVTLTP